MRLTRGRLLRAWITGQHLAERTCVHTAPPQSSLLVGLRSPLPGLTIPRERRHGEGGLEKGRGRAGAQRVPEGRGQSQKGDQALGTEHVPLCSVTAEETEVRASVAVRVSRPADDRLDVQPRCDTLRHPRSCSPLWPPRRARGRGVPAVLTMSLPPWVGVGVGTGPPWGLCVTRALCLPLRKRPIENRWEKLSEKETKSDIPIQRS